MTLIFSVLDGRCHGRDEFTCGVAGLDGYVRQRAGQHQWDGIAITHVLIDDAQPVEVLGYCSLSAAQLYLHELHEKDRKQWDGRPHS